MREGTTVHTTIRRASLILALTPLVSLPASAALAGGLGSAGGTDSITTTITTPAPDGDASAVAAEVDGVVSIGKTGAHAGSGGASSSADAVTLLGNRVSGGDQDGAGSSSGNLVGTGDTPVGAAEVAPWAASAEDKDGGYAAMADAALAHANVADAVELWVLHSQSDASWTPESSAGNAQSDGAEVGALDLLTIKVLHSEAHSTGKGHSDLLVVNDNEIGSSDQFGGMCEIDASPLLHLLCLTATGGLGEDGVTSSTSDVATADVGGGALAGTVSGSSSQGGAVAPTAEPPAAVSPHHGGSTAGGQVPDRAPARTPAAAGALPFTGDDTGRWAATGVALTALGGAMLAFARRRPWAPGPLAG
jgi:hypothetical protein